MNAPYCPISSYLRPGGVWVPHTEPTVAETFKRERDRLAALKRETDKRKDKK